MAGQNSSKPLTFEQAVQVLSERYDVPFDILRKIVDIRNSTHKFLPVDVFDLALENDSEGAKRLHTILTEY